MMSFLDIAKTRYTTKKYDATAKISGETIDALKEILRLTPSSINSQPWKFVFVEDEAVKRQLAKASFFNEQKILDASHLVVFFSADDVHQFEQQIKEYLPEGAVNYYKTFLQSYSEAEIKSWLQHQVYIALGFFLAGCASLQVDATPMEGINAAEYSQILSVPGYKPLFSVALGQRDTNDANQPSVKPKTRLPLEKVVVSI